MQQSSSWQNTRHVPTLTFAHHREPFNTKNKNDHLIPHTIAAGNTTVGPTIAYSLSRDNQNRIPFAAVYQDNASGLYAMTMFVVDSVTLPGQYRGTFDSELHFLHVMASGPYWIDIVNQLRSDVDTKTYKLVEVLPYSSLHENYPI